MSQVSKSIRTWISNHPFVFPLVAFAVPLALRTIPEVLMGPYTVGFDSMGYYIPNTLLWLHGGASVGYMVSTAPLFYWLLMSFESVSVSPVWLIKTVSPILLGFLAVSMYYFAKKGLNWSPAKSTFVAVLGTIYFVALRASWDQLREEFSLAFLFIALMLLSDKKRDSWKTYFLLSLVILVTVLSDQIAAVVTLAVLALTIFLEFAQRSYTRGLKLTAAFLPGVVWFFSAYVSSIFAAGIFSSSNAASPLATWTGFESYGSMLASEGGFLLFCFLAILPLVIISLKGFGNWQMRFWLLASLILCLIPIAAVSPFRWIMLLVYPFAFYATETLSRLRRIKWRKFKVTAWRIGTVYLVLSTALLSFGFLSSTTQHPFWYFNSDGANGYVNQIPTSMLQNTLPKDDCQSTVDALQWFKNNVGSDSVLLTHTAFYGWALLELDNKRLYNYGFENPADAAAQVTNETQAQLYLIWWTNGNGWYGLPTVPQQFHEVYRSGEIAIYNYTSS